MHLNRDRATANLEHPFVQIHEKGEAVAEGVEEAGSTYEASAVARAAVGMEALGADAVEMATAGGEEGRGRFSPGGRGYGCGRF
jgi:hypothetical protein